jgi:hypothetical protein
LGVLENVGPKESLILARLSGGPLEHTGVMQGMSGSPVYIDGKLVGAVALRLSTFSPDAICGITPIEEMLEINDLDKSRPLDAKTPDKLNAAKTVADAGAETGMLGELVAAGGATGLLPPNAMMVPIETPLTFSGFTQGMLAEIGPIFQRLGIAAVQSGGAGSALQTNKPAPGWEHSLNPGEAVAGVLVDGDMSVTGLGTVTYNDGNRWPSAIRSLIWVPSICP